MSKRLIDLTLWDFAAAVGSNSPAPGGGSVAALVGALAAALAVMVARLTVGREEYGSAHAAMTGLASEGERLRAGLLELVDADSAAYDAVIAAYRLPKDTGENKARRSIVIQEALRDATEAPLAIADACLSVLRLAATAASQGNRNASDDAAMAALLAHAALAGATRNARSNLKGIRDEAFCTDAGRRVAANLEAGAAALAEALAGADRKS